MKKQYLKTIYKSVIIFILISVYVSAWSQDINLSKRISVKLRNASVETVIDNISEQSGINFSYSSKTIDSLRVITFIAKKKTIEEVLIQFTKQINIEYVVIENHIVLKKSKSIPIEITKNEDEKTTYTISGYIRDEKSGESLIGATIYIKETSIGVVSNPYGYYSFSLPEGIYTVVYSYIGYKNNQAEIYLDKNIEFSFDLKYNIAELGEVIITADDNIDLLEKSQISRLNLKTQSLKNMPEFGGEVGLIKALQTLPGIKTHSDGSAFFFVRGGNKDHNLILIDDAPIFNHAHLFGYYSAINSDVAQDIKVYTNDMPVSMGDRLSSIIDIHTKQGNLNNIGVNGMLNPLMYRLSVEGPIVKGASSYFVSYRHSNFKWLYKKSIPNLDLYLYDINAKINFKLNNNNRIYFSIFNGKDNLMNNSINDKGGITWNNFATTFRWNHVFSDKLFSNTSISGGKYNYFLTMGNVVWNSAIQNVNAKIDFTYYLSPKNTVRFGYNLSTYKFNPGNITIENAPISFLHISENKSNKIVLYFGDEFKLSKNLFCKIGARLPIWTNIGPSTVYIFNDEYEVKDTILIDDNNKYKTFINFDPRISIKYKLDTNSFLKFSYGIYHQYLQMLSNSISPFSSFEVWLPSGTNIKPQKANQVALSYNRYFPSINLELSAEAYYKFMENQIDYEPHANLLLNPLLEGELRFGNVKSYGIEVLLKKTKGKFTGWLSYTLSRTLKQIEGINNSKEFSAYYDRPHDFSAFLSYRLSKKINVSANWIYYTGSAITTPIGYYDYNGYTVPLYGEKNNDRLPDYHRLDLALNWDLNGQDKKFQHSLSFGIYNFYNRKNPVSINFNKVETQNGKYVVPANVYGTNELVTTQKYLLGIMPSITYKFRI